MAFQNGTWHARHAGCYCHISRWRRCGTNILTTPTIYFLVSSRPEYGQAAHKHKAANDSIRKRILRWHSNENNNKLIIMLIVKQIFSCCVEDSDIIFGFLIYSQRDNRRIFSCIFRKEREVWHHIQGAKHHTLISFPSNNFYNTLKTNIILNASSTFSFKRALKLLICNSNYY